MRAPIRLLAIVIVVLFVVALFAAISGELDLARAATQPLDSRLYHGWPGFIKEMMLFAAGVLALVLFALMSAFALVLAFQRRDWGWAGGTALLAAGSVTLTLGMLGRVRLPVLVGPVLALVPPPLQLLVFVLLVFAPLLAGSVVLVRYSRPGRRDRRGVRAASVR